MVGGEQAGDDRRRARAQPDGERDLALDPEGDPVRRPQRLKARTQRLERSSGTPSPSASTENVPTSSTSSSRCMASAAARTSYPGPRLADEAGTLTSRRLAVTRGGYPPCCALTPESSPLVEDGLLDRCQLRLAASDGGCLADRAVGVLQPVAGEHADHALGLLHPVGHRQAVGEEPGDRGGRGRLAEDALAWRQPSGRPRGSARR